MTKKRALNLPVPMKYIGGGAALVSLPARDLSSEEVEAFGGVEYLLSTNLYEIKEVSTSVEDESADVEKKEAGD